MKGKFFAVGIGPGDPELLTFKAVATIKNSDIIAVPKSGASENIALKIAGEFIVDKQVIECDMPMIKDKTQLDVYHDKSAAVIAEYLELGKTVSFLTLGDPSIYSTVMYVHKRLTDMGYETGIIPGIPSFCGVAAALNTSLCERDEMLHIIPASYKNFEDILSLSGTKILMKSGKKLGSITQKLKSIRADMVECATMKNEKIYKNMEGVSENASYFSIIVIPTDRKEDTHK